MLNMREVRNCAPLLTLLFILIDVTKYQTIGGLKSLSGWRKNNLIHNPCRVCILSLQMIHAKYLYVWWALRIGEHDVWWWRHRSTTCGCRTLNCDRRWLMWIRIWPRGCSRLHNLYSGWLGYITWLLGSVRLTLKLLANLSFCRRATSIARWHQALLRLINRMYSRWVSWI